MLEQTLYDLKVWSAPAVDLYGHHFTEYHFKLVVDLVTWREGAASSAEGLGRAIGDGIRDLAERFERKGAPNN